MVDTSRIHRLIARARRRLRVQAALDAATTASILAFAGALLVVYLVRTETLTEAGGMALLVACVGLIGIGAVIGAVRRIPTHIVATRIDRASGLSDRLATACAFERELSSGVEVHEETAAFMEAALRDAVAKAPGADIKAATPFRGPRDGRAALAVAFVATLAAGLYWPEEPKASPLVHDPSAERLRGETIRPQDKVVLDEDDLDYARELLDDLRRTAETEKEQTLDQFVKEVEKLLTKAENGELTKEQLLEELAKAEQKFMEGADEDVEDTMADLKETGQELQKEELTRELGKALSKGDLEQAQKELEKLAQKLDNNELTDKQREQVAKAMEKAAEEFEKRDAKRESKRNQEMNERIDQAKKELQRLQRKHDEAKTPEDKRRLKQKMDKKKRELKKLERDKEKQKQSQQRRNLKQLHRNMKQASQNMRQKDQKQRRMASRNLRDASRDTGKVDADQRKIAAQKKVASQLSDLKEAMRRARRRGNRGPKDMFGKNKRNRDFRQRARGQKGSRGAWRPGQSRLAGKGNKPGQKPGGQGQQPGGQQYGDGDGGDPMGAPTAKSGNTKDESVSGVHGRGPSRRETILAAAQKGFASRSYKQVYTRYKTIVEEVIRAEKVPSGYKYYVKKYFQKIKPHAM